MTQNEQALMKHFASVLRKKAMTDTPYCETISLELTRYLNRKELIAIIQEKYDGKIPKDIDLLSLENEELVAYIADELYVISYITRQWSETLKQNKSVIPEKEVTGKKEATLKVTPNSNHTKTKKDENKNG